MTEAAAVGTPTRVHILGAGPVGLLLTALLDRYELYAYKQWLRVYMRSKMIKHNKDLLESVGDTAGLLVKLHIC